MWGGESRRVVVPPARKGVCVVCFIFVLPSPLVRGATLRLGIAGRMSSTSLIACIQQLVTLDGRVKLAVSGTREHSGGGWRMLFFFFFFFFINNTILLTIFLLLQYVRLLILSSAYFPPCSDLMWCPRRAEVISSVIPPFFLFPHFCKAAWERALSEGASPICMYITAIYVCLLFCVMSAFQKLSNISFFHRQGPSIFSFVVSPWAFWKAPFSPAAQYLHF